MNKITVLILTLVLCINSSFAQDTTLSNQFNSGNTAFFVKNKAGLLDLKKSVLINANYSSIGDLNYNRIQVSLNEKVGFIDKENVVKIPIIFEIDTNYSIGARISKSIELDKDYKVSKITFYVSVDNNYTGFSDGLCSVIKNGKYGFIDTLGNTVIPFHFDGADNFYNDIAIVKMNKQYGAIDKTGKIIIPIIYDLLVIYENKSLYTQKNNEQFLLNYKGEFISKIIE